jgi:hypothetical protein
MSVYFIRDSFDRIKIGYATCRAHSAGASSRCTRSIEGGINRGEHKAWAWTARAVKAGSAYLFAAAADASDASDASSTLSPVGSSRFLLP